jgi:PAS domain S-box-containing protein
MDSGALKKPRWPRRFMLRGESIIASTGLILASVLLLAMGATAYWTLRVQRSTLESARLAEIQSLGELLSETAALMLSLEEVSTTRRLIIDVGRTYELDRCRIVLPDGQILADADPARITIAGLPASWSEGTFGGGVQEATPGLVSLQYPLEIRSRGNARLEISAKVGHPFHRYWEAQVGVAAIGAVALVALLFVYRRTRARFLALGVIREALLALDTGEEAPLVLAVQEGSGPEVRAWNQLLADRERLQREALNTRVAEALATRPAENRKLQDICDAMRQGVILLGKDLRATYANGAASVYLGLAADRIVGAAITEIVPDGAAGESLQAAVTEAVPSWTFHEFNRQGEEANSVLRLCVRPLRRDDPGAAIITIEDVTQQRVAEEARNAFITQVTHELRAPLTNIRLSAETAIEDGHEDPQARAECLNVINQEAKRLERVVNDMLSVAEIEAGTLGLRKDDVRLDAVFEELESDYARQAAEKDITFELNLPPKLPVIHADREKITLALHNLVNNAVKYTPQGGRVVMNVDIPNGVLVIDVIDSGIGIPESDMDRIFEKFYRAQDKRLADITGSGLGLALAQEVVRLHGGEIEVQSKIDKGSTFTVTMPIVAKAA